MQREWFIFVQLTDKQWIITQQFTHWSWSISILTHDKRRKHIWSLQLLPSLRHYTEEHPPIHRLRRILLHLIVTSFTRKTTLHRLTPWMTPFSSDVSYHTLQLWIIVRYITVCYRWLYRRDVLELLIWASAWDFQQCGMCDQQSLRSACAYAQSDQSLCWLLEYSMIIKLLTEQH